MRLAVPGLLWLGLGAAWGLECRERLDGSCTPANGCCAHVDGACHPDLTWDPAGELGPFQTCAALDCRRLSPEACEKLDEVAGAAGVQSACIMWLGHCSPAECSDAILMAEPTSGYDWQLGCGDRPGSGLWAGPRLLYIVSYGCLYIHTSILLSVNELNLI